MIDGYKRQINDRKINRWIVRGIDRKIYIEIDWQRDRQIATHGRLVEQFQQNQKLGREEEQERRDVGSTKRDVYLEGGSVQGSLRQQIFMNYVFVPFYIFIIILYSILEEKDQEDLLLLSFQRLPLSSLTERDRETCYVTQKDSLLDS